MNKKIYAMVLAAVMAVSLVACGIEGPQSTPGGNKELLEGVTLNEVDQGNTKVLMDDYQEEMARYYTTNITSLDDSTIAGGLAPIEGGAEDTAVLQSATEEQRKFIKETVPTLGKFMEVAEDISDSGIQLYAETSNNEVLSYSYFLDGGIQLTYVKQWTATDSLSDFADDIAQDIVDYIGLDVTGDDIKQAQNMIMSEATSGQYSFVITNEEAMDGFYMSVVGYGTDTASWQVYAQRYLTVPEEAIPEP